MNTLIGQIAEDIGVPEDQLRSWIREDQFKIKHARLPKNSGGHRTLRIPPRSAKLVQYWLIQNILKYVEVDNAAMAFLPGSSIIKNAKAHRFQNYFVKMDLKDFFSSISKEDFFEKVRNYGGSGQIELLGNSEEDQDLEIALFPPEKFCGMGYPISPYISNIVMIVFDKQVKEWLLKEEERFGKTSYTRYADDITISTQEKGFAREIVDGTSQILERLKKPNLSLN